MEYILTNFILYVRRNFKNCDHRIGNAFTFCTDIPFAAHFNCVEKKILHLHEELKHMTIVRIFFVTFLFKAYFVFSYYFMAFISTDAATSFLPLYLLLWPSRNDLFCNHRPPRGLSRIWVVCILYSRI